MALEVGQGQEGIIAQDVGALGHFGEPLAALDGEHDGTLLVHDVHGAEGPAVDPEGLAVLFGGIAVALVEGVGLYDRGLRGAGGKEVLDPGGGDDIGAVLLAGVELDSQLSGQRPADAGVELFQTLGGEVAGKENDGFFAGSLPSERSAPRRCRERADWT
jgi:hypothetical protein